MQLNRVSSHLKRSGFWVSVTLIDSFEAIDHEGEREAMKPRLGVWSQIKEQGHVLCFYVGEMVVNFINLI